MHAGYLSLGSTNITTNNTEIIITSIGDDAEGGLPSLTCHTDNNDNGDLGQWTDPDGNVVLSNAISQANGYTLYIVRNAPRVIKLARRRNLTTTFNFPFSRTGSYCCTIPTIQQYMSLCANLGEWFLQYTHLTIPFQLCACLSLPWTMEESHTATQHWVCTLQLPIPVTLATLSLEAARPGTVWLEGDGLGQLQLVKVSSVTLTKSALCIGTGPTVAPPTTCSDLTNVTNGMISYNMETASPRPVGTVATYTCNPGYTLNGGSTRTCRSDGMWSGKTPLVKVSLHALLQDI